MKEMLVRVMGTVLRLPAETDALMHSGVDYLESLRVGESTHVEVRCVDRADDGSRIVVEVVGLTDPEV